MEQEDNLIHLSPVSQIKTTEDRKVKDLKN